MCSQPVKLPPWVKKKKEHENQKIEPLFFCVGAGHLWTISSSFFQHLNFCAQVEFQVLLDVF